MTQFVIDDQLSPQKVRDPIRRWSTAELVRDLWSGQVIKDERVPVLLRTVRTPSFITIDGGFERRILRDRNYCILYFALIADEQGNIPLLLRRLLRIPAFRTRAARMGKVVRVSRDHVAWWEMGDETLHVVQWPNPVRRPLHRST